MRFPRRPETFEIAGYRGDLIPCALHSVGDEIKGAVVFPGAGAQGNRIGGTPARPDLHYTRSVLQAEGYAVLEVWWDAGSVSDDHLERWLDANAGAALAAAAERHELGVLVGRSLGTLALGRVLRAGQCQSVATIWIAPLLREASVRLSLEETRAPAFVLGGSADQLFDVEVAERLRQSGKRVVVIDEGNHGLEVDDPANSARLLANALGELQIFVREVGT